MVQILEGEGQGLFVGGFKGGDGDPIRRKKEGISLQEIGDH